MPEARVSHGGPFARNMAAPAHLEVFLVSAVTAFLGIRLFLELTGWPQIGSARYHVAHMLWGGLLMLAALFVLLSFLGGAAQTLAAVLGGLGFGTFIDEIGKFVTRDHDYFFRPAVALVYVSFVLVFLAAHAVHGRRRYTPREYLLNALRETEQLVLHDLDAQEQRRALECLSRSDSANPLVLPLARAVAAAEPVPLRAASLPSRARSAVRTAYLRLTQLPGFDWAVIGFFLAELVVKVAYVVGLVILVRTEPQDVLSIRVLGIVVERLQDLSWADVARLAFSGLSAVFVLLGAVRILHSRIAAYRMFERAILVSILLVQVFTFADRQLAGLVTLGVNVILLVTLRGMIALERERLA